MLVYSCTKWPVTVTFHGPVQYCISSSSWATLVTISSQSFSQSAFCAADSLTFSLWHTGKHSHAGQLLCPEESLSITRQEPRSICQAAKCVILVCSLVSRALIIGQRLNQGSEQRFPPSLFPVPHDLLTSLCSLCTWMPQSPILGCNNRTTFNQAHQHNPYFLQAMDLLQPANPLVLPTLSWAFFARFPSFPSILWSQWKEEIGWRGACEWWFLTVRSTCHFLFFEYHRVRDQNNLVFF